MKISKIKPDPNQPRKSFPKDEMNDLVVSIKEHGILQPIIVDRDGHIIEGERRYKAAKKIGLKDVPVVKMDSEGKRLAYQCVVDIQHKPVPILERDKAWLRLYKEMGQPAQKEFARVLGVGRTAVSDALERARYVPKFRSIGKDTPGDVVDRTKFIKDDKLRERVIKKASQVGTFTRKAQYLDRVKKAINEGNVDEVLSEDITDYSKKADMLLHNIDQVIKNLKPGLMMKLPKTQAVILSQSIARLQDHLKQWDNGQAIPEAEIIEE